MTDHILYSNCLPKYVTEGKTEDSEENTRKTIEATTGLYSKFKRKQYIALCGKLVLKEARNLSQDGQRNEYMGVYIYITQM